MINNNANKSLKDYVKGCAYNIVKTKAMKDIEFWGSKLLKDYEVNHLIGLLMDNTPIEDKGDFLWSTDEIVDNLAKLFQTNDEQYSKKIIEIMNNLAFEYYKPKVLKVMDEEIECLLSELELDPSYGEEPNDDSYSKIPNFLEAV